MKKIITLLALFSIAASAQNTFTDSRDGKKYKTVKIGSQTWMAQNLDYHGDDGYLGLCYGDHPQQKIKNPKSCQIYGRLYDWNEAMKACPKGWHLPSNKEWEILFDFVGGKEVAGKKLKAKNGWKELDLSRDGWNAGKNPNTPKCKWTKEEVDNRGRVVTAKEYDICSTDEFGFAALPGGVGWPDGRFSESGEGGSWWSASESGANSAYNIVMGHIGNGSGPVSREKSYLFSTRCIQDVGEDKSVGKMPTETETEAKAEEGSKKEYKPSFDCKKASTKVEKMICNTEVLADLDRKLAEVYAKAKKSRKGKQGEELLTSQRAFVKSVGECNDANCVERMYRDRISKLNAD